jgi:hypothetical protein
MKQEKKPLYLPIKQVIAVPSHAPLWAAFEGDTPGEVFVEPVHFVGLLETDDEYACPLVPITESDLGLERDDTAGNYLGLFHAASAEELIEKLKVRHAHEDQTP